MIMATAIITVTDNRERNVRMRFLAVLLFSAFITQQAVAHGNHRSPITQDQALKIAVQVSQGFTGVDPQLGFGTLPESWKDVGVADAAIHQRGRGYLILKVVNPADEQSLYILMSDEGEVFDANLTGKFKGLE